MDYNKYRNMINKIAFSYHEKTGIDYEDLKAQGNLIFCESCLTFDSQKSSFSTYLYLNLRGNLNNFCNKERKMKVEEFEDYHSIKKPYYIFDFLYSLNEEIREVVELILKAPSELCSSKNKITRREIRNYYVEKGWSHSKINQAFKVIKENLLEV